MLNYNPPKWADWLISKLCHYSVVEELQGDLYEAFFWRIEKRGIRYARWFFIFEVFRSIRFSTFRFTVMLNQMIMMFRNHVKIGWRFIKKHKLYSGLNILGLSLGISFSWLAYFYANDEMSYDKHLPDHENLYRVVIDIETPDGTHRIGGSSNAMTVAFEEQIPEVAATARVISDYCLIRKGEETLEQRFLLSDRVIVDFLDLKFLEGTAGSFDDPTDVIISEDLAGKLDIRGKAVGALISLTTSGEEFQEFVVKGVYENIPENTSVRRDMIMSVSQYLTTAPERRLTTWFDVNMNSLIKLKPGVDANAVARKMTQLHYENEDEVEDEVALRLQPISEIHLNKDYGHYNGITRGGDTTVIKIFLVVGLFCLLISIINYSNFNISLYVGRAREVALRKVIGAEKSSIFSQLITESFLSALIAAIISIGILIAILPSFSSFVQKLYTLEYFLDLKFLVGSAVILLAVAFLSGMYPAFVLSRFSVVKSLKGEQKIKSGKWITHSLLGLQFIITTVLVAGVLTMRGQIQYLTNFDTKIDYQDVVYMNYIPAEEEQIVRFLKDLDQTAGVASAAAISGYNGTRLADENLQFDVRHIRVNNDFLSMLDIDVVAGRNFDPGISTDQTQAIIVNEAFVKKIGLEDPVGKNVPFAYGDLKDPKIIGVVEDYLFEAATNVVDPLVIYQSPEYRLQSVFVKLEEGTVFDKQKFETLWKSNFDPFPFEYSFLEDEYQQAYASEERLLKLVTIGCLVSIFLASMGLLGVVGLQMSHRLKEICIRKVLGAGVLNLYQVFTKRFVMIIAAGLLIGLLISYQLITNWLNGFPYHIDFSVGIITLTSSLTLFVAFVTIISQVFKVVKANPAKYLKDE